MVSQNITARQPLSGGFDLSYDAWGRLVLTDAAGRRHVGVETVRAFPITDPAHWIFICDAEGRELATIEDPASLPERVRQTLLDDLARREFVPVIRRIVEIAETSDAAWWQVETDRGATRFALKSEDDVRSLGPHRALVIDRHGLRYLIADTHRLDSASRRLLERYL